MEIPRPVREGGAGEDWICPRRRTSSGIDDGCKKSPRGFRRREREGGCVGEDLFPRFLDWMGNNGFERHYSDMVFQMTRLLENVEEITWQGKVGEEYIVMTPKHVIWFDVSPPPES